MASLTLSGFVQNPVSGAGVPGARVYVFGRDVDGNKVASPSTYDDTDVTGRYEVTVDTAVVQTTADKGYHIEFRNTMSPNQTRIIRTDVEFQVKYIHGLRDAHDLIPAPLMDGSIKTEMLANADASKGRGVSLAKMLPDSVGTLQLLNANVTQAKLAKPSVGTPEIIDGSVTGGTAGAGVKIAANTITSANIADNSIMNADINTAADISGSKLANASVPYAKLAADVLTGLDPRFVNIGGDTITGNLTVNGIMNAGALQQQGVAASLAGHTHSYLPLSGGILTNDIWIRRSDQASPSTGLIHFGDSGSRYLYYDGSNYSFVGTNLYVNGGQVWHSGNLNPSSVGHTHAYAADSHTHAAYAASGHTHTDESQAKVYATPVTIAQSAAAGVTTAQVNIGLPTTWAFVRGSVTLAAGKYFYVYGVALEDGLFAVGLGPGTPVAVSGMVRVPLDSNVHFRGTGSAGDGTWAFNGVCTGYIDNIAIL